MVHNELRRTTCLPWSLQIQIFGLFPYDWRPWRFPPLKKTTKQICKRFTHFTTTLERRERSLAWYDNIPFKWQEKIRLPLLACASESKINIRSDCRLRMTRKSNVFMLHVVLKTGPASFSPSLSNSSKILNEVKLLMACFVLFCFFFSRKDFKN